MKAKFILVLAVVIFSNLECFGQKKLNKLKNNHDFTWLTENLGNNISLYFEKDSYAEEHKEVLIERIRFHLERTMEFIEIDEYNKPIHYFVLENRQRMKQLFGFETNGLANPRQNYLAAIFSVNSKSVYSNHELFHLLAMNEWGYPKTWVNEGMAVYSDNIWHGYDLHKLSKFLIDSDRYIPLKNLISRFMEFDNALTYPLVGSFVKYIAESYGIESIKEIWRGKGKDIGKHFGKSIEELEKEWLQMLDLIKYDNIIY